MDNASTPRRTRKTTTQPTRTIAKLIELAEKHELMALEMGDMKVFRGGPPSREARAALNKSNNNAVSEGFPATVEEFDAQIAHDLKQRGLSS